MAIIPATLSHYGNEAAAPATAYPDDLRKIASLEESRIAVDEISRWPGYQASPLYRLESLADEINVREIFYKDESQRFGLKSFNALGGAYTVARQLQQRILAETGDRASISDLLQKNFANKLEKKKKKKATKANHPLSLTKSTQK
mgnify:CR=1 FL=1